MPVSFVSPGNKLVQYSFLVMWRRSITVIGFDVTVLSLLYNALIS
jgi:hypothetical protein